jgi:hypothetical protein
MVLQDINDDVITKKMKFPKKYFTNLENPKYIHDAHQNFSFSKWKKVKCRNKNILSMQMNMSHETWKK